MNISLLMVDDSHVDALLVENALLNEVGCPNFSSYSDPEEFLSYTESHHGIGKCLVLLDINMPKINGFEVLEKLRSTSGWELIPVIVFSTSSNTADIKKAIRLGANAYMIKPLNIDEYQDLIRSTIHFWKWHEQ
ncbi:response regulator [Cyclobacterium jeungdonense]|uniref:Response regulator n=1 Tax=Cyclobacterium jeungdonense TaxID=708087 RepID=A0ABT8CBM9_9BACT|nr:response regulator [Cyclobacterium jeungdonense]MDN3690218.1 response regulator [Cyclobacterium jeungdonense]